MSQQTIQQNTADALLPHRLMLTDRASLILDGVTDVVSFDESAALVRTSMGLLSIDGEALHVTTLNLENGHIELDGKIHALIYIDGNEASGRRLFGRRAR